MLDVSNWIKITGANHLDIPYLGYTELRLTIGQHTLEKVGVRDPIDPHGIVSKQKFPGLLGINVFKLLKDAVQNAPQAAQSPCPAHIGSV